MAEDAEVRWRAVRDLIDGWWPPLRPQDGVPEEEIAAAEARLGLALPAAFREWHRLAGRRNDFFGNQDEVIPIRRVAVYDGTLAFAVENQGVVLWGLRLADLGRSDDPPVCVGQNEFYFDGDVEGDEDAHVQWERYAPSLSQFTRWMVVLATVTGGAFTGWAGATPEMLDAVRREYPALDLGLSDEFFGDQGTLVWSAASDADTLPQLRFSARTRAAVDRFVAATGWAARIQHSGEGTEEGGGHWFTPECRDQEPLYILRQPFPYGAAVRERFVDCREPAGN